MRLSLLHHGLDHSGGRANCSTYPFVIVLSTHGEPTHARQLAAQPARLGFELNRSGTNLLMVNESKPRSAPAPPREGGEIWGCPLMVFKKKWGVIALCASRGESHKHVGALRLLGQVLGRMSVVLVRTCLPCLT